MDDIVSSNMPLNVGDLSHSADIVASDREAGVSSIVLDPFEDFVVGEVVLDSITNFNLGVGEPDGPGVVSNDVGDHIGANAFVVDLEQLELN